MLNARVSIILSATFQRPTVSLSIVVMTTHEGEGGIYADGPWRHGPSNPVTCARNLF